MRKLMMLAAIAALVICAAMPALAATLGPVLGPNDCQVAWQVPTTNTDGTPLIDLASFQVFLVQNANGGSFPTTPSATITVASPTPIAGTTITYDCRNAGLKAGQYWAQVKAVDLATNLSAFAPPNPAFVTQYGSAATINASTGVPFVFKPVPPSSATGLQAQ